MKKRILSGLLVFIGILIASPVSAQRWHHDNPPGWRGGPGTSWENPPGWRGSPQSSPNYRYYRHKGQKYRFEARERGYYYNSRFGYYLPGFGFWIPNQHCWWDRDDNPPGLRGGRGTNWENPPGLRGGQGSSPDRFGTCR